MEDYEFSMLKSTVASQSFDSNKLSIAKTALRRTKILSRQTLELMELLSFESNKLSLAKYAYDYTIDKGNYFIVNNAFSFSSSVDELSRYISRR
jgi:nuclear transport factor 2 (NTF2) superfamily protein